MKLTGVYSPGEMCIFSLLEIGLNGVSNKQILR
jgi:hypothetical protein